MSAPVTIATLERTVCWRYLLAGFALAEDAIREAIQSKHVDGS